MNHAYRTEILTSSLDARIREVTEYQVNIDNFRAALALIGNDAELADFTVQLKSLLASSLTEIRKAQIMLDVIQSQLEVDHVG
jgi:hypothetical protein